MMTDGFELRDRIADLTGGEVWVNRPGSDGGSTLEWRI
jgi:hypothetical protein